MTVMTTTAAKKLVTERNKLRREYQRVQKLLLKSKLCSPEWHKHQTRLKEIATVLQSKHSEFQAAFLFFLIPNA